MTKLINNKRRKFSFTKIGTIIAFVIFALYALSLLFPFVWLILNSLRSVDEYNTIMNFKDYLSLPKDWAFTNYITILTKSVGDTNLLSMFINSIILTVLGTIVNVFFSTCAAYVLAKYKFKGRNLIYAIAIFSMVVPIVGTLPSQVKFMEALHLNDKIIGVLFLYSGTFGFNFILLYSAFEGISWNYAEAAQMDGGSHFTIFFKVMIPLCKGPIISCCILQAITLWNDYSTPFLFLNSRPTLAVGLEQIKATLENSSSYPLIFAAVIISILPVLILYACFQKKIVENTVAGGLKG